MADIPHFKTPFQILGNQVATVEQDSDDDILTCVETLLRTPVDSRLEHPEYGVEDTAFTTSPETIENEIRESVNEWEPRAEALPEATITNQIATVRTGVNVNG